MNCIAEENIFIESEYIFFYIRPLQWVEIGKWKWQVNFQTKI